LNIEEITFMATLDLGERLTIEVVVVKLDLAVFGNEKAAIAPPVK
jgi:hypothetical protein